MREDEDQQLVWEGVFDIEHIDCSTWAPEEPEEGYTWEQWEDYMQGRMLGKQIAAGRNILQRKAKEATLNESTHG